MRSTGLNLDSSCVGMIAADTFRSRAYLSAMCSESIKPCHIIFLPLEHRRAQELSNARIRRQLEDYQGPLAKEANFDFDCDIKSFAIEHKIPFIEADSGDINHPGVIEMVRSAQTSVLVYSGYGGVILRQPVLSSGKKFLHVHGGFVPQYRGSTAAYYSLLEEKSIGASAIFLTEQIDKGPVIGRAKFPPPCPGEAIDLIFDSAARARLLVSVLKRYRQTGRFEEVEQTKTEGFTYYVIHPVLKHVAILGTQTPIFQGVDSKDESQQKD